MFTRPITTSFVLWDEIACVEIFVAKEIRKRGGKIEGGRWRQGAEGDSTNFQYRDTEYQLTVSREKGRMIGFRIEGVCEDSSIKFDNHKDHICTMLNSLDNSI